MKKLLTACFGLLGIATDTKQEIQSTTTNHNDMADVIDDNYLSGFGYKVTWYAIDIYEFNRKNLTINELAKQLNLKHQQSLAWNDGLDWLSEGYYGKNTRVFITPNLYGYIYVITGASDTLDLLNGVLDNYYAFTSYRATDAVAWKIVQQGEVIRYFSYGDGIDNQSFKSIGKQTWAENQLGLPDIDGLTMKQAMDKLFNDDCFGITDEDTPAKLNELLTGKNPTHFDNISSDEVKGLGVVRVLSGNLEM